jgi:hypothetical protein
MKDHQLDALIGRVSNDPCFPALKEVSIRHHLSPLSFSIPTRLSTSSCGSLMYGLTST